VGVGGARVTVWPDAEAEPGRQVSRPKPATMQKSPSRMATGASQRGMLFRDVEFPMYSSVARIGERPHLDYSTRSANQQNRAEFCPLAYLSFWQPKIRYLIP
jgi:hypothetical protein